MNRKQTFAFAAAALSGMLAGSAARAATVTTVPGTAGHNLTTTAGQKAIALDNATNDCKGKNACKGQGGCKTGDNGCKGKNSCKGNGGCKTTPTTQPGMMF